MASRQSRFVWDHPPWTLRRLLLRSPATSRRRPFVTDPETAARIALARDAGGGYLFPDAGPRGGSLLGLPSSCPASSPRTSSGGILALIDGAGIAYGAEGVRTMVSDEATLEMRDDPSSPAEQVSLFQTNAVAVLSEVGVNWKVVRPGRSPMSLAWTMWCCHDHRHQTLATAGIHDYLGKAFAPVDSRINALEARLNALEARGAKSLADCFKGAWLPGHYQRGDLIQHRGSMWLCIETGDGKPGESWNVAADRPAWQGRPGRSSMKFPAATTTIGREIRRREAAAAPAPSRTMSLNNCETRKCVSRSFLPTRTDSPSSLRK